MAFQKLFFIGAVVHALCAVIASAASDCAASSSTPIALTLSNVTIASQDTSTHGIRFDVGVPKQSLCLTPSTVVDNTLLISTKVCASEQGGNITQPQCRSYHGGTFDLTAAGTSFQNVTLASAKLPSDPGWTQFNPRYTVAGNTNFDLVANVAVPNMTVAVVTEGVNFTAGHIGLGPDSVLLHQLKANNMIPSIGFGLNAGSQSIQSPRDGNLVLGGYDSASVTSPFHDFPMNYSITLAGRYCPLQVHIQGLQLILQERPPIQLVGDGDGHAACIEPYDNLFRFSEIGLERFMSVTGWSEMFGYKPNNLFLPEPGLVCSSSIGFNRSLKFTLDDGFTVEIPNSELQHPLRGLDEGGDYALQSNVTEVNIYSEPLKAWVLGKVFLSQVYLVVDYEAGLIKLADVRQSNVTPSPVKFSSANAGCKKAKLFGGTIAAIVLGAIVALALISGVAYYLRKRQRKRQLQHHHQQHNQRDDMDDDDTQTVPDTRPSVTDINPTIGAPLSPELSGEGKTHELPSPNGGYPPPSPHAPHQFLHASTSQDGNGIQRGSNVSTIGPQTRANQPWDQ